MIEVSLQGFQDLKAWDSPLATFDSYQIPYLMQKHHRRRFPTSRPDHSFTAKLLCCAAHLEKAAWSRGHKGGQQGQAARTAHETSEDQLPSIYASSQPKLLSDFCLHWEVLAISPCFCCGAESSQTSYLFVPKHSNL